MRAYEIIWSMHVFIMTLFLSLSAFAQHAEQPQKENTEDLRSSTIIFSVEEVDSGKIFLLERTPNLDHFLRFKQKEDESIKKTDTRDAKKLDQDFAARFIRCQYEIASTEGKCEVVYKLHMKGEDQEICKKDDKKSQEILSFVQQLKKRF